MNSLGNGAHVLFMFSDEATFQIGGRANKHNCVVLPTEQPKEVREHMRNFRKKEVCCVVRKLGVIEPFFLKNRPLGERITLLSTFMEKNVPLAIFQRRYFQQDDGSARYSLMVRDYLNDKFGKGWIDRGGPFPWPTRSSELTP
ncbi:hypothetical protein Trydic_g17745 [Trypoxylus dichotomus]